MGRKGSTAVGTVSLPRWPRGRSGPLLSSSSFEGSDYLKNTEQSAVLRGRRCMCVVGAQDEGNASTRHTVLCLPVAHHPQVPVAAVLCVLCRYVLTSLRLPYCTTQATAWSPTHLVFSVPKAPEIRWLGCVPHTIFRGRCVENLRSTTRWPDSHYSSGLSKFVSPANCMQRTGCCILR